MNLSTTHLTLRDCPLNSYTVVDLSLRRRIRKRRMDEPSHDATQAERRQRFLAEASVELLVHAQQGDDVALDVLCQRYIPLLQRWASGRLPNRARDLLETSDVVQETVIRTVRNVKNFEVRRDGALLAYLRQGVMNRIRDEARRVGRKPVEIDLPDAPVERDRGPSPLDALIGRESVAIYERALARLKPLDREAVIARVEMGMSFEQVAAAIGKASANTARMTVNRALVRLAEEMAHDS